MTYYGYGHYFTYVAVPELDEWCRARKVQHCTVATASRRVAQTLIYRATDSRIRAIDRMLSKAGGQLGALYWRGRAA